MKAQQRAAERAFHVAYIYARVIILLQQQCTVTLSY